MFSESEPLSALPPEAELFRCEISHERDTAHIRAVGELDVATVPILATELAALRDGGFVRWVLDLRNLDFMDSSGLRCILECHAEAQYDGFSIALIRGPRAVQRVFELTSTAAQLPFADPDPGPAR
jgi:anti-anti-sigma factor